MRSLGLEHPVWAYTKLPPPAHGTRRGGRQSPRTAAEEAEGGGAHAAAGEAAKKAPGRGVGAGGVVAATTVGVLERHLRCLGYVCLRLG